MKKILVNIIILLVAVMIFFAVFEVVLRLFFHQNAVWNKYHEYFVYTSNAGEKFVRYDPEGRRIEMQVNEKGYRGPVIPYENAEGKKRIFVVGDSFVECFGPGLENCFTTYIQERLGDGYEVIAYGTASWALDNEYKVVEIEGMKYGPGTVIVAYFVNDFWDATRDLVYSVENGSLRDNTPIEWGFNKRLFFHANQYSYVVRFFTETLSKTVSMTELAKILGASSFRSADELEMVAWGTPRMIFFDEEVEEIERAYEKAGLVLDNYKELSEREGFRLIFTIIPIKEQVSERYLGLFRESFNLSEEMDINLPYDRIMGIMKRKGIEVVDARDKIRERQAELEAVNESLYYEDDAHFNPHGQEMLGKILLEHLE